MTKVIFSNSYFLHNSNLFKYQIQVNLWTKSIILLQCAQLRTSSNSQRQASCPVYDTRGGEKSFRMCTREKGPGNVVVSLHTVEVLAGVLYKADESCFRYGITGTMVCKAVAAASAASEVQRSSFVELQQSRRKKPLLSRITHKRALVMRFSCCPQILEQPL